MTSRTDDPLAAACEAVQALCGAAIEPPTRVVVDAGGVRLEVRWGSADALAAPAAGPSAPQSSVPTDPAPTGPSAEPAKQLIGSPMVGTFYRGPAPGEPPFVAVGDQVVQGQQVGIVEAMKLMNPVVAMEPGIVAELLADDGSPVEYGQPLFALVAAGQPAGAAANGRAR